MSPRRSHYELAFEAYLDQRGTPYVPVEDVARSRGARVGAKLFDYLVYPSGAAPCLVDVKGRQTPKCSPSADVRQRNWVTKSDLEGLSEWSRQFGEGYDAGFVFVYWIPNSAAVRGGGADNEIRLAGRRYGLWLVRLPDYLAVQKQLSPRWDTVSVPSAAFRGISRPLASAWPAAPC